MNWQTVEMFNNAFKALDEEDSFSSDQKDALKRLLKNIEAAVEKETRLISGSIVHEYRTLP